jgi:acyl-[acyl-carrier-protein] desaturase
MPDFRRNGVLMAKHGIYDPRQHLDEVLTPTLRKWRIFERDDFSSVGEQRREQLAAYLAKFEGQVVKFEEQRERLLARTSRQRAAQAS